MTNDEAKAVIATAINDAQGCKPTELLSREDIIPLITAGVDVVRLVDEMILDKLLVEIEYVLPNMDYRLKSFLLPAGTEVSTHHGNPDVVIDHPNVSVQMFECQAIPVVKPNE